MQVLTKAQIPLGSLDRCMPQGDLDLLEGRAALVGKLGEGAAQIMRRDLAEAGESGIADDGLEDGLSRDRPGADEAAFRDRPQHGPRRDPGGRGPLGV